MTLRGKILLKIGALLCGFALMGAVSVWGFASLRVNNRAAQREFQELREIRSVGLRLATDRALLKEMPIPKAKLISECHGVLGGLQDFITRQETGQDHDNNADAEAERAHDARERLHADQAAAEVHALLIELDAGPGTLATADYKTALFARVHTAMAELDGVVDECTVFVATVHKETRTKVRVALIAMSLLSLATLIVATLVGISLYRSIVHPLRQLSDGVREIAAQHFSQRLPEKGDPEFLAVTREFNRMAAQLEDLYTRLEDKVAQKSRELVRSERLASVGFLAAGVAHEIRNPLGIISGYAELSLKMASGESPRNAARESRILGVIRDEAFRCKQITDKLLGLVQGSGEEGRQSVDLARVVRDVAFLVKGLTTFRERGAAFHARIPESLCVWAHPIEIKQVLLNLTLNALEAVEPGNGRIEVEGKRVNGHVQLQVRDNGCGMTPDVLEHVFEPFFTSKRGRPAPGTGLGLSITHAIVEGYGGTLRGESEGAGRGSCFTIEWPVSQEVPA